jgi:ribose transport system substrate-binding protein
MKHSTRAIAVAGIALVIPLAACTSSKPTGASPNNTAAANPSAPAASAVAAPPKATKNYNIPFIQGVTGDQFYITMQCGAEAEAAKLGVTVKTQGPQKFDPTLQKPILDSVVAGKPDAILIAPTDVTAMQTPLKVAAEKGIKVILVDTTTEDPSYATSAIASDNVGGGKAAFEAIKKLNPGGGKVMVMSTDPGVSTVDLRIKGFEEAANADPACKDLPGQYSHNDPATAANLFSAAGTATAVKQAGKSTTVKIASFDAGPNQVKRLRDGTIQALVAQQPGIIGQYGVDEAVAALDGGTITQKVQTGFTIITKDNIDGEGGAAAYKSSS